MNSSHHFVCVSVLTLAVAISSGCQKGSTDIAPKSDASDSPSIIAKTPSSGDQNLNQQANNMNAAPTDIAITSNVKSELISTPDLKSAQIDVETNGGIVTLTGTIDTLQNMHLAAQVAGTVNGVKSINNQLRLKSQG